MRTVRFKEATTLQDVIARVVDRRSADPTAAMKRVEELNSHVDFKKKIRPGTVLILPEEPGIKRGDKGAESPGTRALEELGSTVFAGFEATEQRVGKALEKAAAERADLVSALKTGIAKRQTDSDPAFRKQLDEALATTERRQKELKEAAANVELLRKSFAAEFKAMEKLFR